MKLFKKKKGIADSMIWWFIYVAMTLIVYLILKSYTGSILIDKTSTHNLEYILMQNKIIEALSYKNPNSNRVELGIVDINKFNDDLFKEIEIPEEMKEFGIRIGLIRKGVEKVIFYDKGYYEKFYELRDFSHMLIEKESYILVKENNQLEGGKLTISIIARKKR